MKQRHWQHWTHKTEDENKQSNNKNTTQHRKLKIATQTPSKLDVNLGAYNLTFVLYYQMLQVVRDVTHPSSVKGTERSICVVDVKMTQNRVTEVPQSSHLVLNLSAHPA